MFLQLHEPTSLVESILAWAREVLAPARTRELIAAEAAEAGDGSETAWSAYLDIKNSADRSGAAVTVELLERALQRFPFSVGLWLLLAELGGGQAAQAMHAAMPRPQLRSERKKLLATTPTSADAALELLPMISPKQCVRVAIFLLREVLRKPFALLDCDYDGNNTGEERAALIAAQNKWEILSSMHETATAINVPSTQPERCNAGGTGGGPLLLLCHAWVQLSRLVHARTDGSGTSKGKEKDKEKGRGGEEEKEQEQEKGEVRCGLLRCWHLAPWHAQVVAELNM